MNPRNKINILIVDTHSFQRHVIEFSISEKYPNCKYFHADSTSGALSICKKNVIDLIITEIAFPTTIDHKYIRQLIRLKKKTIILSSEYVDSRLQRYPNIHAIFRKVDCKNFIVSSISAIINGYRIFPKNHFTLEKSLSV